ncbi:hypothetical protein [Cupriavidus necator]|uniref:hypothetical protein n=1 Tax=Cupriavidus necator TaxID=106590 RepID=UPI00339D58F5
MNKILSLSTLAMAMLAAAGTAHAQHVVGGMGEEVRIGAFTDQAHGSRNRGPHDSRGFSTAKRAKAPARAADRQDARRTGVRAPAAALPGRHLP